MAIQNRRGVYTDFDPTKMKPGEFAIVQSGDPNSTDGKAVYICTTTGVVRRLVSELELGDLVDDAMAEELATKVDKVTGMGLSTNNYTNADKLKLAGITDGAKLVQYADSNNDGNIVITLS